jgi:hypothetical protein
LRNLNVCYWPLVAAHRQEITIVRETAINPKRIFTRLVYFADQDADEILGIYANSITGGIPVQLNGTYEMLNEELAVN